MEKQEKINVKIDETLKETENKEVQQEEEEEGEGTDILPPEEFPDKFQCPVCLSVLFPFSPFFFFLN